MPVLCLCRHHVLEARGRWGFKVPGWEAAGHRGARHPCVSLWFRRDLRPQSGRWAGSAPGAVRARLPLCRGGGCGRSVRVSHDSGPPPKRRGSSALQAGALRREHQRPREKKRHPGEATRTWREAPGGTPSPILTPGLWRRQTSAVRAAEAGTPSRPARHPTAHPRERAGDSRSPAERRRRSRTVPGLAFALSSGGRFRDTRFPVAPSVLFAEAPAHAFCYFH